MKKLDASEDVEKDDTTDKVGPVTFRYHSKLSAFGPNEKKKLLDGLAKAREVIKVACNDVRTLKEKAAASEDEQQNSPKEKPGTVARKPLGGPIAEPEVESRPGPGVYPMGNRQPLVPARPYQSPVRSPFATSTSRLPGSSSFGPPQPPALLDSKGHLAEWVAQAMMHHLHLPDSVSPGDWRSWADDLAKVQLVFDSIQEGLWGPIVFSDSRAALLIAGDTEKADKAFGYVTIRSKYRPRAEGVNEDNYQKGNVRFLPSERGHIHLNFSTVPNLNEFQRATCIIHEASHKFWSTKDHAYHDQDNYRNLTTDQAIDNADSIAYASISLFKKQFIPKHNHIC